MAWKSRAAWSSDRLLSSSNDEAQGSNEGEEEDLVKKFENFDVPRFTFSRARNYKMFWRKHQDIKLLSWYESDQRSILGGD